MTTTLRLYEQTGQAARLTDNAALTFFESIDDVYSYHVRDFVSWARAINAGVNIDSIRAYFEDLNASDFAANTKRIKRQGIKRRIRQLMENAPIDDRVRMNELLKDLDRSGKANAPKIADPSVHQDKVLSPTEVDRLLSGARSRKQYYVVKFLYATGCRIAEACGIKKGHVENLGDRVKIRITGKGNKERFVIVPATLWDEIRGEYRGELYLFETRGGKRYSTSYVSNQIAKLGKHILNRKISAHTFRHSFATTMLRRGVPVEALSRYLGHSSVKITLDLYCHAEMTDTDILAFVNELI